MIPRPKANPSRKQETPQELLDACLGFLARKFYEGPAANPAHN